MKGDIIQKDVRNEQLQISLVFILIPSPLACVDLSNSLYVFGSNHLSCVDTEYRVVQAAVMRAGLSRKGGNIKDKVTDWNSDINKRHNINFTLCHYICIANLSSASAECLVTASMATKCTTNVQHSNIQKAN